MIDLIDNRTLLIVGCTALLLAGLIGIAATLLGSFTTYLFQSRTAERAQAFERDERLSKAAADAWTAGKLGEATEHLRQLWASAMPRSVRSGCAWTQADAAERQDSRRAQRGGDSSDVFAAH